MVILSKGCKPDNFESHNSLKLSFMNIWGLRSNFVDCESFLESNSPDILALCETNLDDSLILAISAWGIPSKHFSVTILGRYCGLKDVFEDKKCYSEDVLKTSSPRRMFGRSYFNRKGFYYPYAWSRSLCEGRTSFCKGRISSKLCRFLLTFSNGFTSLSILLPFPLSITFSVFMHGF